MKAHYSAKFVAAGDIYSIEHGHRCSTEHSFTVWQQLDVIDRHGSPKAEEGKQRVRNNPQR